MLLPTLYPWVWNLYSYSIYFTPPLFCSSYSFLSIFALFNLRILRYNEAHETDFNYGHTTTGIYILVEFMYTKWQPDKSLGIMQGGPYLCIWCFTDCSISNTGQKSFETASLCSLRVRITVTGLRNRWWILYKMVDRLPLEQRVRCVRLFSL